MQRFTIWIHLGAGVLNDSPLSPWLLTCDHMMTSDDPLGVDRLNPAPLVLSPEAGLEVLHGLEVSGPLPLREVQPNSRVSAE